MARVRMWPGKSSEPSEPGEGAESETMRETAPLPIDQNDDEHTVTTSPSFPRSWQRREGGGAGVSTTIGIERSAKSVIVTNPRPTRTTRVGDRATRSANRVHAPPNTVHDIRT